MEQVVVKIKAMWFDLPYVKVGECVHDMLQNAMSVSTFHMSALPLSSLMQLL
jgi:hypothetical protein